MVSSWLIGTFLMDVFIVGMLLALPAWFVRNTWLKKHDDDHLYGKLLGAGFFFSLAAVSGMRGLAGGETDSMTAWFLPLVGAYYLHVAVTYAFDLTLKISLCFLFMSYPVEWIRSEMHGTVVPSPLEAVSKTLNEK